MTRRETDPNALASLAKGSLTKKIEEVINALTGKITEHHQFMLQFVLQSIQHINNQIAQLEARMDNYTRQHREPLKLLQTIRRVSKQIANGIIAEIGVDMNAFPTHANLSSWAGV